MINNLSYNVAENAVVIVKTESETLRNIALRRKFRNEHIKESAFNENIKVSIE